MKTDNHKKAKIPILLPVLVVVTGVALAAMKIYADSEPGAFPLLLIVAGAGWYLIKRVHMRSQGRV